MIMDQRLLLLSNSTLPGEPFLGWPAEHIRDFLGSPKRVAFVPYAAVTFGHDEYTERVAGVFKTLGHEVYGLHAAEDPVKALEGADAVAVGGGNTFQLLRTLYTTGLLRAIRKRVRNGLPYIGWSAGSNVACPTVMTTNDMPICEPPSLHALHVVGFQINPHYTAATLEGHGGESRDQRLAEYLELNRDMTVAGLPEGSLLRVVGPQVTLEGRPMKVFRHGQEAVEVPSGARMGMELNVR